MDFYFIPPANHIDLDLMHFGNNRYFALAHLYHTNRDYREWFIRLRYSRPDAWITLDNGAAEHSLVTEDVLIDAVKDLQPNEVIAPDVLFDFDQTIDNLEQFIIRLERERIPVKVFGCPQGANQDEWIEAYMYMHNHPSVSTIGLSKIAVPKCWMGSTGDRDIAASRNKCVQYLKDNDMLGKPIHLLGMGEHDEFQYYKDNGIYNIRSSDSCYTILAAINGISFRSGDTTRIPTDNSYFDQVVGADTTRYQLAVDNMMYLKEQYNG